MRATDGYGGYFKGMAGIRFSVRVVGSTKIPTDSKAVTPNSGSALSRIQSYPKRNQRAKDGISNQADGKPRSLQTKRHASAGEHFQLCHQHQRRGSQERNAHSNLYLAALRATNNARAEPGSHPAAAIINTSVVIFTSMIVM